MSAPFSVVINTWNNAETLEQTLESVKTAAEIIIVDMHSSDNTCEIAKKFTDQIFTHPYIGYVEPARNFAIEKAAKDWVFVLDSDEETPPQLFAELSLIAATEHKDSAPTHYFIPRKNLIFGSWVQHAGWWPDNQLRFFRKGSVSWQNEIHSVPVTTGKPHTFPPEESYAIIHHNYTSVSQWITRMDRYTTIQSKELSQKGYTYAFSDNLNKPFSEFIRRFFVWKGYKDGVIGLNLALLQALSEVIVYLKVRELQKPTHNLVETEKDFQKQLQLFLRTSNKELQHWLLKSNMTSSFKKLLSTLLD